MKQNKKKEKKRKIRERVSDFQSNHIIIFKCSVFKTNKPQQQQLQDIKKMGEDNPVKGTK